MFVTLTITDTISPRLRKFMARWQSEALDSIGQEIANLIRSGITQGKSPNGAAFAPLKYRSGSPLRLTGRLEKSIRSYVSGDDAVVEAPVEYATTQQFGAKITPTRRRALLIPGIGFVKSATIPERSFFPVKRSGNAFLPNDWGRQISDLTERRLSALFQNK